MKLAPGKTSLFLSILLAVLAVAASAFAIDKDADGWYLTGSSVRVKTVALIDFNVYKIDHFMKELPATKSKQAVIEKECTKKFVWTMKRDVENEKIVNALKDAFKMNGYTDDAKIKSFIGAFSGDLKEKGKVKIVYDADKKNTTVTVDGGGTATIDGVDFMKGVWSIWFGKIDQKKLGDELIANLP